MACHVSIPITDASSIGEARRAVVGQSELAGLNATDAGRASIVATELATNLIRHAPAGAGTILIWTDGASTGSVEITSIDTGPGMADVERCFADGYSTGRTPGNGLGAVKRLSEEHDVYSSAGGTVLWCRIASVPPDATARRQHRFGAIAVPAPHETFCGDCWRLARSPDGCIAIVVADGLGHGPLAAEASEAACKCFDADPFARPPTLLETMHGAISGTRGAAVAVIQVDPGNEKLTYAGVGNIAGTLIGPDAASRGLFSHNGTVGHTVRKIQAFEYPWPKGSLVLIHSDGVQTRWSLDEYPGLSRRHPAVIAGALLRDFRRGPDDSTVVVLGPVP